MQSIIEAAWNDRALLQDPEVKKTIREVVAQLDAGILRVAAPDPDGQWITYNWIKKAVILYFPIQEMQTIEAGPFERYFIVVFKWPGLNRLHFLNREI